MKRNRKKKKKKSMSLKTLVPCKGRLPTKKLLWRTPLIKEGKGVGKFISCGRVSPIKGRE